MTDISIIVKIVIPDEEKFKREIYEQYGEVNEANVEEFIENHLTAHNTCDNLFLVEGANGVTVGWIVQECNLEGLMNKIGDEEEKENKLIW